MLKMLHVPIANMCRAFLALAVLSVAGCGSAEDRAQSHYERGMKLIAERNYVAASIELKNAVQFKRTLVAAWRGLAEIEERNQNWVPLANILRTVVELDPKDNDARVRLAKLMLLGNALDESLKLANVAVEQDGQNPSILAFKASVLLKLNDPAGAVREAKAALAIDPVNTEAMVVLAAERLTRGDAAGALEILDSPAVDNMANLGVQIFKIQLIEKMGNIERAEALLQKMIQHHPKELLFQRQLVRLYLNQKRFDDAERELRGMATATPGNVEAGLDVVRFLGSVRGPAAARQELLARANAGGDVFQYQLMLAALHFAEGNTTDSIQLLENLATNASSPAQAATAKVRLAELHLSMKKIDAAEAVVADILRKDGRNTDGLRLRATIGIERGNLEAAIIDVRQALNDQPRSAGLMLLLASAYERSGAIELADKQFADATKASGYDASVGLTYVTFLRRRGSVGRAEDVLTELVNRWPTNFRVLSTLAEVRLTRQNWAGAQEIAETIRRVGEDRGLADQILGAALGGRNQHAESIKALESAYAAAPASLQSMYALVGTYVRAQKTDQAVAFLETVLKANPSSAEALVLLGSVYLVMKQPDRAVKSFTTAIEQQPKSVIGHQALAGYYINQKNTDEALKIVRSALQVQPDSSTMRLTLASVLELKGDYEAAIKEYEAMLKEQSGSLIVANNLASLLSEHRTDKASIDRAYSIAAGLRKSQVPHFKDTLGWIYYHKGDYKTAISLLSEAAAELPNMAMVRYHLGVTYVAAGERAKATEELKKARDLARGNAALDEKIEAALKKAGA